MKNKILQSSFYEKLKFLLILVGVLIGSVSTQMWSRTVYFDTDGNTFNSGATNFVIYLWGGSGGDEFHLLQNVSGNLYSAEVGDGKTNCLFMSKTSTSEDWSNKTGQSKDQNNFTANNLFTVTWVDTNGDIYGNWSTYSGPAITYSVAYDHNGKTGGGSAPTDATAYDSGDQVTVAGNTGNMTKSGYVFAGWNTSSDYKGTYYAPGSTFSITSNITLYAMWFDSNVLSGTNVMFYAQSYDKVVHLTDGDASNNKATTNLEAGLGYINIAKSDLSSYYYITNNQSGDWGGNENVAIKSANGGERFVKGGEDNVAAKTAATTRDVDGDVLSLSTTCNSATGVYNSKPLYILYYVGTDLISVTYSASTVLAIPASTSAQASTYNVSGLSNGSHTLKTILTDGLIYYIADTDEFDVAHSYTITYKDEDDEDYSGSNLASLPSSYTYGVGATLIDGVRTGFDFEGWYTDEDCTEGPVTSIGTSATGAKTFYAKWTERITDALVTEAGTGITSTSGDTDPVTLNSKYAISATVATGYTFNTWTADPAANGTFDNASSASTNVTVKNGSVTVTASATENMTTVTINSNLADAGTLTVGGAAFTPGNTTTAGVTTSRTVVATPAVGNIFQGWTVTGNATGSASTNTYTLKGNGSAGTGSLMANFGVATGWYMKGHEFGGWESPTTYQFTNPYRGMSGIYYIPVASMSSDSKYWRVYTGSTQYNTSASTSVDNTVSKGTIYSLSKNDSKASIAKSNFSDIWIVVNTGTNKKLWIQDPQTFHNVNVTNEGSGSKGTYKVTLNTTDAFTKGDNVFETTQYEEDETFDIVVTGVSGWIPTITIGDNTPVTWWKEASTYTTTGTMGASDVTVTISYTASYAVTFETTTGGSTLTATGPSSTTITTGTKVKSGTEIEFTQTPTHSGYDFSSWNSASTGDGSDLGGDKDGLTTEITAATSVYPIYSLHTYTGGTLDKKEGSKDGSYSVTYNATSFASKTAPTRTGYNVEGYYVETERTNKVANADGSLNANKTYTDGSSRWTYTSSIPTLYTQWQANEYSVTLDKTSGSTGGSATATYNASSLSGISAPTKTGYHVEGYYDDGEFSNLVATAAGALQSDIAGITTGTAWTKDGSATLYANWEASSYTVTFNDQEATTHGTASTSATYDAAMPAITVPRKDGYIFGGYYTSTGGAGTKYYNDDGSSARTWNIASETTLHAKWTGINYHVSFSANGGEGSMSDEDFVYGTSKALTTNTFTRSGYYFLGWNTNADGSGTAYHDGKSVSTMTIVPGETVILYAQWAKTQTLYFLNLGTGSWTQGASAGETTRYAYAYISYDGYVMYPLGTWTNNGPQGAAMTASASISIPNVTGSGGGTWCWSIANVPEGATIIFSDNNESHKTGDLSGWTAAKPYYCFGNDTWYALDGENTISPMTNWSVHIGKGHFGDSWKYYALDKYDDGTYAKIWLNTDQTYQYKYSNWFAGGSGESGSPDDNAYIINGSGTTADYGGPWTLNGSKDVLVKTNSHASGEYKFSYEGLSSSSPITKVYVPRGVNLTTTTPTEAKVGESVTVSFTADAWEDPKSGNDMDNPTYYFEYSTDNNNWTTVATYSAVSAMKGTASYTFTAQTCYFRVKLVNDHGLASYSGSTKFTAYTTKSFYLYNPWYDENWSTLHLQAWDSNDGDKNYNGSFPGHDSESCEHGNSIVVKGNGWYYITIDERANKFLFAGNETYNDHKTEDCTVANYIQDAKYMIKTNGSGVNQVIAYEATGNKDYRLKYTYGSPTKTLYSPIYNTDLDGTTITTSMWLDASQTSTLVVERGNGADSWESTAASYAIGTSGGGLIGSDYQDYGYVFTMTLNTTTPSISNVAVYNGPYYVRTDGLEGGWNVYKTAKHLMYHSEHSLNGTPAYDHYLCKWIGTAETNVKFTVANEYNPELVASLAEDPNDGDPLYGRQDIPTPTNVRFAWNSQTNTLTRAYLSAATDATERFLMLVETSAEKGQIFDEGGSVPANNELLFSDKGNWVYQLTIQAKPGAEAKVTAKYNGKEPEFIPSTMLIGGDDDTQYIYRIVYDFKTNELTSAWVADGSLINTNIELNTNVMIIRKGQYPAKQITFGDGIKLTEAKKVIGVMEFQYQDMVGKMSSWNATAYQYCMYYISFPFDVKVSDIFGVGEMGTDWRLQKYNGEKRSQIGWFAETSTFWEDVKAGETLKAYEGYSLLLNRVNFNNGSSGVWTNISSTGSVYLYFPSNETSIGTIAVNTNKEVNVPSHICNIDRWFAQDLDGEGNPKDGARNHKITDSNWNMLGTALFQNKTGSTVTPNTIHGGTDYETTLNYIYEWRSETNTLAPRATLGTSFSFNAMHAYLVQFAGKVVFEGASISPKLAARRVVEEKNYMIEVELNKGETFAGRAYVELRENAVDSFLLNEDMYMLKNSKTADLYTYAGRYDVAANVLTVGNHVVPVGVNVKSAGEYTFSMPSNFSGEVTLIDTYTNTHTNLALEDYTVYLSKGEITDRFLLEININKMPTAIDGVEGGSLKDGKAHKFIENGQMYILQNGVIYDAQGKRVK